MAGDIFNSADPESLLIRSTGILSVPSATAGDVLTVQSDKTIAADSGGSSNPTNGQIATPLTAVVTLTDAEILTLPTFADRVTIVPNPGVGKMIFPLSVMVAPNLVGAYTNRDGANTSFALCWDTAGASFQYGALFQGNTSFFSFTGGIQCYPLVAGTLNDGVGDNFPPGDDLTNKAFTARSVNGADGNNFTGGNGLNVVTVTCLYVILSAA